ncbi:MAG: hypothetical protein DYG93_08665 [Leptolyngbya sp. PLA2]|nr:hypothetical protein [Leptolyngbya sp.]MCE7971717.1 hypothetical protein [Leptolyngbya sp. PL-A2]MDL1904845.1 hypothetical protein [Synechococcales cyanobacterium CNB]GIK19672.1 MAG: hypothetical protein BroJett004_18360 [Planctomycetota bacterium]
MLTSRLMLAGAVSGAVTHATPTESAPLVQWLETRPQTVQPATDDHTPESLASAIVSGWPAQGSIFAHYTDEHDNDLRVAFDFASRAWNSIRAREVIVARDPDGVVYAGRIDAGRLRETSPGGADWVLDHVFPQVGVVNVLRAPNANPRVERANGGGWIVVVSLPRASRYPPAERLSEFDIQQWGGPHGMYRDVTFVIRDDLTVASITRPTRPSHAEPGMETLAFDTAETGIPGFQVVRTHPPPGKRILTHFEHDRAGAPERFTAGAVLREAELRRIEHRPRVQVMSADEADASPRLRPAPIRDAKSSIESLRIGLLGGGVLFLVVGALAWFRLRRA